MPAHSRSRDCCHDESRTDFSTCVSTCALDSELGSSSFCGSVGGEEPEPKEAAGEASPCKMLAGTAEQLKRRDKELRTVLKTLKDRQARSSWGVPPPPHDLLVGHAVRAKRPRYRSQGAELEIQASWSGVVVQVDEAGDLLIDFSGHAAAGRRWVRGRHAVDSLVRLRGPAAFRTSLRTRWRQCLSSKQQDQGDKHLLKHDSTIMESCTASWLPSSLQSTTLNSQYSASTSEFGASEFAGDEVAAVSTIDEGVEPHNSYQ